MERFVCSNCQRSTETLTGIESYLHSPYFVCPVCGAETELRKEPTPPDDPVRFTELGPLQRPHDIELDMLIARIGEIKARELSDLALRPTSSGMSQQAFDELAKAVKGHTGIYGAPSEARAALEALRRHYAADRR